MRYLCFPPELTADETVYFKTLFSESLDNQMTTCTLFYSLRSGHPGDLQMCCNQFKHETVARHWTDFESKTTLSETRVISGLPPILIFDVCEKELQFPIKGLNVLFE